MVTLRRLHCRSSKSEVLLSMLCFNLKGTWGVYRTTSTGSREYRTTYYYIIDSLASDSRLCLSSDDCWMGGAAFLTLQHLADAGTDLTLCTYVS